MHTNKYPNIATAEKFAVTYEGLSEIEKIRVKSYMQGVMDSRPTAVEGQHRDSA